MAAATQVRLANHIAAQFRHLPHPDAVNAIAAHLASFWEPRMREQLRVAAGEQDPGLDPLAAEAARRI